MTTSRAPRALLAAPPTLAVTVLAVTLLALLLALPAQAESCPNEQLREREVYALRLPDCRAYEQVSPVDKGDADAIGAPGYVQASPSGEGVTYFSLAVFPVAVGGTAEFPTYLSNHTSTAWLTQGLLPSTAPASSAGVIALTEDLSKTIIFDFPRDPLLTPEAMSGQYIRDNATESYQLLVGKSGAFTFVGATPNGSRILFEEDEAGELQRLPSEVRHQPEVPIPNLYEWNNGQKSLIATDAVAGAGPTTYRQNAISQNGSRVFFTDLVTKEIEKEGEKIFATQLGRLYMRENGTTFPISEPSQGSSHFRAATPDGRYVFYTDEAGELWRFDVETNTRQALAGTVGGAIGVLGVSNDGSYAYFANGSPSLYEWHDGTPSPTLIAGLTPPEITTFYGGRGDENDWVDGIQDIGGSPAGGGRKSSLVTPDGRTVLFFKGAFLFLYDASTGKLTQVTEDALLGEYEGSISLNPQRVPFLTHNLSEDGSRIFFETKKALLPQDTNGAMDVYEWERKESGSCGSSSENFRESSGGCIYLISTGKSSTPSYFGDASTDGDNVFFFTRQSFVGQDQDNNVDIYDARVGGGLVAQNPSPQVPCVGDACLGSAGAPPTFSSPSSVGFLGAGDLTPSASNSAVTKRLIAKQRLIKALKECRRKAKKRRSGCEVLARKRFGIGARAQYGRRLTRAPKTVPGRRS
jgi:hypothetical protein